MPEKVRYAVLALKIYAWFLSIVSILGILVFLAALAARPVPGRMHALRDGMMEAQLMWFIIIPVVIMLVLVHVVPAFLAISGIKARKEWGRILGIVAGVLVLFSFPLGTIAGIFALYGLLSNDAERWIKEGNTATNK